jgi:hypothetical protein
LGRGLFYTDGAADRLPFGATVPTGTAIFAGDPATVTPAARVHCSTTQSIPNRTNTALVFDAVFFDHGGYWNVVNPTRLTVPVGRAGLYSVGAQAHLQSGPSTVAENRGLFVLRDGSDGLVTTSQHVRATT